MSALRIGQRVKLVRCDYKWGSQAPIGAEGVITGVYSNKYKRNAWLVYFYAHPSPYITGEWLYASHELEPILEDGDFATFMESVLRPTTLDESPAKHSMPKEPAIVR